MLQILVIIYFVLNMNNRKSKIAVLKQKIINMQNQLKAMEDNQRYPKSPVRITSISKDRNPSQQKSPIRSKQYKSPTFWNSNPITHQDKYFMTQKIKRSPIIRSHSKENAQRRISPTLKDIINTVDHDFYIHKSTIDLHKQSSNKDIFNQTTYIGKRFENSIFGQPRNKCVNDGKIKTFSHKVIDPILNPEKQRDVGIKIVKKIEKSPNKMLTDNPKSNPNLYIFLNKPTLLQKKNGIRDKNVSNLKLNHSVDQLWPYQSDLDTSLQRRKKSQKKHFSQYFQDTLLSQIE